ncbi:MAG: DNA gyrase C-terminal beta-propeller domain-containing protein, partial [Thermoplasmata archaeon]
DGIVDLRDESDREGIRIVVELRRDVHEEIILNQLYAHTPLQVTFGVINLALVDGEPRVLSLKETLEEFIRFREEIVRRRTEFDLRKAKERLHIVEGLLVALDNLDEVISLIKSSESIQEAREFLEDTLRVTALQAKAILDLRLQRLTAIEHRSLREEGEELTTRIDSLEATLTDRGRLLSIIRQEILELRENYGDERRTTVETSVTEFMIEDLIPEEDNVVTITNTGYIKRLPMTEYKQQKRGGKGRIGFQPKEEDFVVNSFVASTHDYILFFSSRGKCYWLKTFKLPLVSRYSKGKPIINLLPRMGPGERIHDMIPAKLLDTEDVVIIATKQGFVKRVPLLVFNKPKISGIIAIDLREGDDVVEVKLSEGDQDIFIATRKGWCLRFPESWVRVSGRVTRGAKAIKLANDDYAIGMHVGKEPGYLLTITEKGLGKLTDFAEYRYPRKFHPVIGCRPLRTLKTTFRTGDVVALRAVAGSEEIIVTTRQGKVLRTNVSEIRKTGRIAQGVKIISLEKDDLVAAATCVVPDVTED